MIKSIMIKSKNVYNLESIEKIITYIPVIFIFLLTVVLLIVSYFVIESKQNKEIQTIKQESIIKYEFKKKEKLKKFAQNIKKDVNANITGAKTRLQKIVYVASGYIQRLNLDGKSINDILEYLNKIEKKTGIFFVLFEKDGLKIYRGKNIISYISDLIFSTKKNDKDNRLVKEYIYSQGNDNFQYWIDDIKKTVRVSFFDAIYVKNKLYYLGAFSIINNLRSITKNIMYSSIKKDHDDHFWLYDFSSKEVYNFFGKDKTYSVKKILKNFKNERKYVILNYYKNHDNENTNFKNQSYLFKKFKFAISINYSKKHILKDKIVQINKIRYKYKVLFLKIVFYILSVSILIIIFSFIFLRFVKDVFKRYNRRLNLRKESLQHWKKRFELAVIASNDGMWDIDFSKNSIYFSKKWLDISEYNKDEIKSFADWFLLIHEEDRDNVHKEFNEIIEGKKEHLICEYRLKTKNHGYKWILARGRIFKNEKKAFKRMLMMSMDIDKSKRMSKELLNVEMLVEDGRIIIFKCNNDKDLSVKFVSNSIKSYGYFKDDFEHRNINYMDIVYEKDKKSLKETISLSIKTEQKSFSKIYRIVDNAGKIRWIYSRVILLKDDLGDVRYLYGYIYDITKLKRVEEDLKLRVDEEIEKNRQKDSYIIQQNKLAAMGGMLGSISHQWRQPLNNVQLILHFLRDNFDNKNFQKKDLQEYIQRAKTQIEYMSQTIDDFRDFYKPSKSKNSFDIKDLIESSLKIIDEQFKENDISIKFLCEKGIVLYNYENELKQSILNILNNAKDALLQKKETSNFNAFVKIEVKKEDNFAIISIENNGGNIEKDILDRIFEPYFTTKFEKQGTGIGLYMTKVIIEKNLKGKIEVINKKNGVEFKITLPMKEKNE